MDIATLLEFCKTIKQTQKKEWYELCLDFIEKSNISKTIAIFKLENLNNPVSKRSPCNYIWNDIGKKIGKLYKIRKGIWKISFQIDDYYILHLESQKRLTKKQLNYLELICNISNLWLETFDSSRISSQTSYNHKMSTTQKKKIVTRKLLQNAYPEIIGESPVLIKVLQKIDSIAKSGIFVLIEGESGTGKELIAKAIHSYSTRSHQPFITENCTAIPETLLESELFGYKRGAFTGAYQNKKGLFEIANKGILFLDEIGDISLGMQKKLLRVLENGDIRNVGGEQLKKVDVRIIAATNKNLKKAVREGTFRQDLYYRLNIANLVLPPLRERKQDILILFNYFVKKISKSMGIKIPILSNEAKKLILEHKWPGNIRELQNEIKRLLALLDGDTIFPDNLSLQIRNPEE